MKTVGMIGHGAFGTAVATVLTTNGFRVKLWCYQAEDVSTIEQQQCNPAYLPGVPLSNAIEPTNDLQAVVQDVEWVFEAIPVQFLRSVLKNAKPFIHADQKWVVLSKGIEQQTLMFPSQIVKDVLGSTIIPLVCAGPSFAIELARKQPTGLAVAAQDASDARSLKMMLQNSYIFISECTDVIGVQLGGAFKNVAALGIGILDGAGYQENSKALFLTRIFNEIKQFAACLGAQEQTLNGLSGFGDLVMTSMGTKSRNREVGKRIAKGQWLATILEETGYIPEGINTVKSIIALQQQHTIELPLLTQVYRLIFAQGSIASLIEQLIKG